MGRPDAGSEPVLPKWLTALDSITLGGLKTRLVANNSSVMTFFLAIGVVLIGKGIGAL